MPGRPTNVAQRARTERFLTLVADGNPYIAAAREARIDPWRALAIVSDPSFEDIVAAVRQDSEAAA